MADAQEIIQAAGPLPLKQSFIAPVDGPVIFFLSGSAWSNSQNMWVGIGLQVDGEDIGATGVFCNEQSSHHALIPRLIPTNLSYGTNGEHTLTIYPTSSNTITDQNDLFYVTLLY